jgi:hypothetical protein
MSCAALLDDGAHCTAGRRTYWMVDVVGCGNASAVPGLRRRYRLLTSTDITKGYTDCNVVALARERRGTGTAADTGTTRADVQIPIRKSSCPLPACGGRINSQLKLWIPSHHTGREHQHGGVQSAMRRCVSPSPSPCLILDIPVGQLARGVATARNAFSVCHTGTRPQGCHGAS